MTEEQSRNGSTISQLMKELFDDQDGGDSEEEYDDEPVRKVRKKTATDINDLIAAVPSALDV